MNESQTVDFLIQWSIRGSVIVVFTRLLYRLWRGSPPEIHQRRREYYLWFAGFMFLVLHVCLSFHFVHHWLHSDAWNRTASETDKLFGIRSGHGIWANYLMLGIWGLDLVRLYKAKRIGRIPSILADRFVAVFFGFMFINSTIVFGPLVYRYLACPTFFLLIYIWHMHKKRR